MSKPSATVSTVETFLRGSVVCPFAKGAALHFVEVSAVPRKDRYGLLKAARAFVPTVGSTPYHALVVVGPVQRDAPRTRAWAEAVFGQLLVAFAVAVGDPRALAATQIRDLARAELLDDEAPMRPRLACGDDPLFSTMFSICLAPWAAPPRWAPLPLVLVTWVADVVEARRAAPELVQRIRERATREHGAPYDADALWLVPAEGGGR